MKISVMLCLILFGLVGLVAAESEPMLGPPLSFDDMFDACPTAKSFKPCRCNVTSKEISCGLDMYEPNEVRYIFKDAQKANPSTASNRYAYSHLIFENSTLERLMNNSFADFTFMGITVRNNYYLSEFAMDTFGATVNVTRALRFDNNPHLAANNESTVKLFKVIQQFVNVENLIIHKCRVQFIPTTLFTALPRIKRISLKYNEIKRIQSNVFTKVPTLRFIHLSGNQIDRLESSAFVLHTSKCRRSFRQADVHYYIDLDDNQLQSESFAPRSISSNCSLDLNIVNNSITYLPEQAFKPLFETYTQVHMHGNSIDCTHCQMAWLQNGQFCPTFNDTLRFYVMIDSGCTHNDLLPIITRCPPFAERFEALQLSNTTTSKEEMVAKYLAMYPKDFFEPKMSLLRCPDQFRSTAFNKVATTFLMISVMLRAFIAFV